MIFFEKKIDIVLRSYSRLLRSAIKLSWLSLTFLVGMAISTRAHLEVGNWHRELDHRARCYSLQGEIYGHVICDDPLYRTDSIMQRFVVANKGCSLIFQLTVPRPKSRNNVENAV